MRYTMIPYGAVRHFASSYLHWMLIRAWGSSVHANPDMFKKTYKHTCRSTIELIELQAPIRNHINGGSSD